MGLEAYLRRATDEEIDLCLATPSHLGDEAFSNSFYRSRPEECLELFKEAERLHFLMTGTEAILMTGMHPTQPGNPPLDFLGGGGIVLCHRPDDYYRGFPAMVVRSIAGALERLTRAELRAHFSKKGSWREPRSEAELESWFTEDYERFEELRTFVRGAAKDGRALILFHET